eukprot:8178597-Pyramimonas_sp.AAC.1
MSSACATRWAKLARLVSAVRSLRVPGGADKHAARPLRSPRGDRGRMQLHGRQESRVPRQVAVRAATA